uniref:TACC_C domain-containing protein n=1 Tax=Panagrellus redivivus TaxID=6233 RepID=A0A7E4VQZ3_PANRE
MNLNDTFEIKPDEAADVAAPIIDASNILDPDVGGHLPTADTAETNATMNSFTDASLAGIIDGTKTMIISKNRTRPNLPEAKTERKHHRRSTFSVDDNHVSSDVANMINTVRQKVPKGDDEAKMQALIQEVALYLYQKEKKHAEEIQAIRQRGEIMRLAQLNSKNESKQATPPPPPEPASDVTAEIAELERIKLEAREKHIENLRLVSEYAQEAERFAELEKVSNQDDTDFSKVEDIFDEKFIEIKGLYDGLLEDGTNKCEVINAEVEKLAKEHAESISTVNNEIEAAESAIKQHEAKIADLAKQKDELLEMMEQMVEEGGD